ncbi:septum site-determining protein MinC [Candidatus Halobeggiatoa sp. HSG11]|nr:septum site-determining protein MinC [Candidatus Halobeggiatoa sp. HSG11]
MSYSPAIEFKGSLLTLMILHVLEDDSEKIAEQIIEKVSKVPDFFQQAPVIIDLTVVQDAENEVLSSLIKVLREQGLVPVAVRSGNAEQNDIAISNNLGILKETQSVRPQQQTIDESIGSEELLHDRTKVITQPIRSGQQIVAPEGDLIILSTVSHGSEILAHQNIHVYGVLRGRALAGFNGNVNARIFCQNFHAELVSIAGQYQVNEDLPDNLRGKPVQIYLEDNVLKIEPL